jgi:tRNA-dihydrouridine synthase B
MNQHLEDHYAFYGEFTGVRTARKHIGWYTRALAGANAFRHRMNTLDTTREQLAAVNAFFDAQKALSERLVYSEDEDSAENVDASETAVAAERKTDPADTTDRLAA